MWPPVELRPAADRKRGAGRLLSPLCGSRFGGGRRSHRAEARLLFAVAGATHGSFPLDLWPVPACPQPPVADYFPRLRFAAAPRARCASKSPAPAVLRFAAVLRMQPVRAVHHGPLLAGEIGRAHV